MNYLSYIITAHQKLRFWLGCKANASEERNTMATMRFKLGELERRFNETSTSVKDCELEIEFELAELPGIIKEIPSVVNSFSNAAEKSNSREWEKACNEINEAKEKLYESERNTRAAEARAEAAERRVERLKEEKEELKEKLNGNPAIVK